jgi:hypothetical protein
MISRWVLAIMTPMIVNMLTVAAIGAIGDPSGVAHAPAPWATSRTTVAIERRVKSNAANTPARPQICPRRTRGIARPRVIMDVRLNPYGVIATVMRMYSAVLRRIVAIFGRCVSNRI